MTKYSILFLLPLAMACTKKPEAKTAAVNLGGTEIAKAALAPPAHQILGVVQFQDKCAEKTIQSECLAVIGGDDLTESRTFYLPGGDKSAYERVPSDSENKKFRVKLNSGKPDESIVVADNQHVALLAQLDKPTPDGNQRIGELQAIQVVEK